MTASSTFAPRPFSAPFKSILHFHCTKHPAVSVEAYLQVDSDDAPTAGEVVSAALAGGIQNYENWDVATVNQSKLGGFDVFLPEDHDARRRQLIIELSKRHNDGVNIIPNISKCSAEHLQGTENSYRLSIKNLKSQHYTEMKGRISVELKSIRSHYYQYFTSRLRIAQQQLENAWLIATLATFDGIMRGLNGLLVRGDEFLEPKKLELAIANLIRYDISCVEDLFRPNPNCTAEEQEAKQSILRILPLDYRGLAGEVYTAQSLTRAKIKSTILQYPQISKIVASKCVNRSDMHDKFKEIGRWFIHSNPQTDNSEDIFGSEDSAGVEGPEEEVKETEDIIQGLRYWGDPTESESEGC